MKYDLEERVGKFGEAIISFAKTIRRDEISRPLINQRLSIKLYDLEQVLGRITWRQMRRVLERLSATKLKFAAKSVVRQSIG